MLPPRNSFKPHLLRGGLIHTRRRRLPAIQYPANKKPRIAGLLIRNLTRPALRGR